MNNKTKGEFSEARTLYEFQKYNIPVCLPWGDNQRYDMIAEFNGKLNRIQIKTSNEEENGSIKCYCRSSKNHTTNKHYDKYIGEVDYFVFYNQTYDIKEQYELNGGERNFTVKKFEIFHVEY